MSLAVFVGMLRLSLLPTRKINSSRWRIQMYWCGCRRSGGSSLGHSSTECRCRGSAGSRVWRRRTCRTNSGSSASQTSRSGVGFVQSVSWCVSVTLCRGASHRRCPKNLWLKNGPVVCLTCVSASAVAGCRRRPMCCAGIAGDLFSGPILLHVRCRRPGRGRSWPGEVSHPKAAEKIARHTSRKITPGETGMLGSKSCASCRKVAPGAELWARIGKIRQK